MDVYELLNTRRQSENDISILIGKNGSGKSQILAKLARKAFMNGSHVITIANTIHDKFPRQYSERMHTLSARSGRRRPKEVLTKSLTEDGSNNLVKLKILTTILDYIGYDEFIGLEIKGYDRYAIDNIVINSIERSEELEEIIYIFQKLSNFDYDNDIIRLDIKNIDISSMQRAEFLDLLRMEGILKNKKIIKSINIILSKSGKRISLNQASSGELSLLTTVIFLSSVIEVGSVIFIDEPENSLHPKWQREYVDKLLNIFSYYQPKIIIATHSPLIVSDSCISRNGANIYQVQERSIEKINSESISIEKILWEMFGVTTPENHFLSSYAVNLINDYSEGKISKECAMERVDSIRKSVYDERQVFILDELVKIINKIDKSE